MDYKKPFTNPSSMTSSTVKAHFPSLLYRWAGRVTSFGLPDDEEPVQQVTPPPSAFPPLRQWMEMAGVIDAILLC